MRINIKQRDVTDCGAACLASIGAFYRVNIPVSKIRQLASTDRKGTNILGLIEAAKNMGFSAKGVRADFDAIYDVPKPSIAHVVINRAIHHYVVIYKISDKWIEIMDPAHGGMKRLSHAEFKQMWTGVLVLLMQNREFKQINETKSVIRRFWFLIRPHQSVMIQVFFGALVYTLLGLSTSIYIQKIVDHVFVGKNANLLNLLSVIMLVLLGFQVFIGVMKSVFIVKIGQKIDARLILGYYQHLLTLPQRFFDTMRVGEIISRISDAFKIRTFINDVSINLIVNVFVVIFSFGLMFTFYWKLAVVMLMSVPIYFGVYWITNRLNKKMERRQMENVAELESQLVESITAIGTIKRFGAETHANIKTETRFINLLGSVYQSTMNGLFASTSSEGITKVFIIVLLWVGAGYVLKNEITPGELMSFYALTGYLTGPVSSLIGMNKTIQNALIAADRLFEIMDLEVETSEQSFSFSREHMGDIVFSNVCFRYGTRVDVFSGLDLSFQKGKISGVVGESGSGKSTLISLLQNLYPVQSGTIHIGEYNIRYIKNESLRKFVSVVPQKIDLFSGNLVENIALGDYQPDMHRIVDICKQLGMMDFIEGLPNGVETYLGENGASISGGQRQRIAIARALYREPEILVMDEATSSLDPVSEGYVQQTIRQLANDGRTIIFITHRLSTVCDFDRIYVMEKGNLVEEGSHSELISHKSAYYDMVQKQMLISNGKA
ncbi:peptidase domain-containing ABC transporter [Echinicola shivajiensis]|uniref:peptidase domain-containing ABC transporter n=1 Tax=Echinicola shivajiensis TaxID=1035916 RepID=UPI001BFCB82D|nr:peptidase domain-containing ABC transporter [Echinicola shivajiensis]